MVRKGQRKGYFRQRDQQVKKLEEKAHKTPNGLISVERVGQSLEREVKR